MSAVRSCFAAVPLLVVAIGWPADAAVCCDNSSAVPSCRTGNRTFHAIETIGGGQCGDDDDRTAVPVRKCCPPDRTYDPETRFCGPAAVGADSDRTAAAFRRWTILQLDRFPDALVGYDYESPKCGNDSVLVDVPAGEVRTLLSQDTDRAAVGLPSGYCFDVTPSEEIVARTCRPRDQYCNRGRYTCVNKCCKGDRMIVADAGCKKSELPFRPAVYEADADGRPAGLSNNTALPYHARLRCSKRDKLDGGFALTVDGSLYRTGHGERVPAAGYCVEFYTETGPSSAVDLQAFVCASDAELSTTVAQIRGSWKYFLILAGFVPSIVCLAITLLVYATLSGLRNVHGYYVICYVACLLLSFICLLTLQWTQDSIDSQPCKLFGYFTLFSFLATFCWLNVICFDIYWMLRYNNSIIKNTSISVRTIIYHIYCWGFSSISVSTGYYFQHSQHATLLKFAPDIGILSCWFSSTDYGYIIFFILPVSVTLTANLILFMLTAIHCSRIKSELNKFKRTDLKTQRFLVDKEKFVMSIKLFLVMGIPWSFDVLSKIFPNDWIIWYILDEINALQGVMIFFIFVAKRKVIMSIRKKFTGSMDHSESTKMNTISGSSQSGSAHKSFNDF